RSEMKAIQAPSGDHRGLVSLPGTEVSCHAARPSAGTIQRWVWYAFATASAVVTVHTTWDPSGASCGSLTIFTASRSSIVIGRPAGARASRGLVTVAPPVFPDLDAAARLRGLLGSRGRAAGAPGSRRPGSSAAARLPPGGVRGPGRAAPPAAAGPPAPP